MAGLHAGKAFAGEGLPLYIWPRGSLSPGDVSTSFLHLHFSLLVMFHRRGIESCPAEQPGEGNVSLPHLSFQRFFDPAGRQDILRSSSTCARLFQTIPFQCMSNFLLREGAGVSFCAVRPLLYAPFFNLGWPSSLFEGDVLGRFSVNAPVIAFLRRGVAKWARGTHHRLVRVPSCIASAQLSIFVHPVGARKLAPHSRSAAIFAESAAPRAV